MKHQGPLLGYNNNVTYQGKVYHVQTEDSGTRRPRVLTHLFADGGRVVSSSKTDYRDLLDAPDRSDRVRSIMKQQHKAMVIALRDGEFDALIGIQADPDKAKAKQATTPNNAVAAPNAVVTATTAIANATAKPVEVKTPAKPRPFGARYHSGRRLDEVVAARLLLLDL